MSRVMTEAGQILEEIQERTGWSLAELAYQLRAREGVKKSTMTISSWRNGATEPKMSEGRALERLLRAVRRQRPTRQLDIVSEQPRPTGLTEARSPLRSVA